MEQEKDDLKFKDLIKDLNQLQEVKAPKNFESDLLRKINSEDFSKEKTKTGFWDRFISPARLIPIGALAAVMIAMLIMIDNKPNMSNDPLLAAPRERKDLISSNDISLENFIKEKQKAAENLKKDEVGSDQIDHKDSDKGRSQGLAGKSLRMRGNPNASQSLTKTKPKVNLSAPAVKTSFAINKSGLNFRQVNLSKAERKEVEQLREKMLNSFQKQ